MARIASEVLVHSLESLFEGGSVAGLSDRQLLGRFTAARNAPAEAAFAALVARHGPMVLDSCHQILGDLHHAEDAFQAVFLVLARRAPSIRDPDLLANWLYGVSVRTARCAKLQIDRRRKKEETDTMRRPASGPSGLVEPTGQPAEQLAIDREQAEALHSEIARLPGSFRLPVVLCYFEGLTLDEAARRLRCPVGTTRSRLARARDKIKRGLIRRGVTLPATALAAALSSRSASASLSPHVCETIARAALQFTAGQSAAPIAAALARAVLRSMLFHKSKLISQAVLLLGALAASAGYLTQALATNGEPKPTRTGGRSAQASRQDGATPNLDPDRITITGRVLAPDGKPVSGARVAVVAKSRSLPQDRDIPFAEGNQLLGSAQADAEGRFRLDFPRIATDRDGLALVIGATGWALKVLDPNLARPDERITLEPERVARGRIIDVQGQPIPRVSVRVTWYAAFGAPLLLTYEIAAEALPWPAPATTDEQGRFTMRGLGRRADIGLEAISNRHAPQRFRIGPGDDETTSQRTITLSPPAQVIEVHVTGADDGRPQAGAWVCVISHRLYEGIHTTTQIGARTNEQGLAQIIPPTGNAFEITAGPPARAPYLNQSVDFNWPKGAVRHSVELKLERGVPVRGTITEEASGRPVAGASVIYLQTHRNNRLYRSLQWQSSEAVSGLEGKFQIVAPAGPGHLLVRAATPEYLHLTTTYPELGVAVQYNRFLYPDALAHIDLKPDETSHEVAMRLRRGVTVTGRVVGPDGNPVAKAIALGRTYLPYTQDGLGSQEFSGFEHIKVRDGRLEIPGCDPEKPSTFYVFDSEHLLGATVKLSAKSAPNGPVMIQLQKCGAATVRYKDPQGKPIVGNRPDELIQIITPGAHSPLTGETLVDCLPHSILDQRLSILSTDAGGLVTFVSLIPGARYEFDGYKFTAEADKTIDLPDVTTEADKPPIDLPSP